MPDLKLKLKILIFCFQIMMWHPVGVLSGVYIAIDDPGLCPGL